jgi:hypothetical protein
MGIDFAPQRWDAIKRNYTDWWAGRLERPLINIELVGRNPDMPRPRGDLVSVMRDLAAPLELIMDHWEYHLASRQYVGDAYPNILPDFGAGVNAAFMGANALVTPETVWFSAQREVPMHELHFSYNPHEPWYNRILDIYRAAAQRFVGNVCLGMTHLNNGIDPVARFFSGEAMLLALYDEPDEVLRLIGECHDLFWRYFQELRCAMGSDNRGYTCWCSMFSVQPHFILQSDFSYMISPAVFERFILPELRACCKLIPNAFYHLDGVGQLDHLDMILSIPELKGVQWIPGDGQPDMRYWPDVYRKIHRAGKLVQLIGGFDVLDAVAEQIGTARGIYTTTEYPLAQAEWVMRNLERYGVA